MKKGINEFYTDLGKRESHGDYTEFNDYDYLGKYQMGEAALVDTGYYIDEHINYSGKCDWKGTFTGKDGVYSREDFLSNPQAQENANREYKKIEWNQLKSYNADKFLGKKVKGILITQSGLLAAAHLRGAKGTADCIKNPNSESCNPNDAYGTSIYKYLEEFAGYDISEITGLPSDAFDFPEEENQKSEQKQPEKIEGKIGKIQEEQKKEQEQSEPKEGKIGKAQKKEMQEQEQKQKLKEIQKSILYNPIDILMDNIFRILWATILYGFYHFGAKSENIEDSTMTLKKVLKIVAKNNNMKLSDLIDFLYNKIIEIDTYEQTKYMMKYLNQVPSFQNLNSQAQKPINMNFAELIKQPQVYVSQNQQFYPQAALKYNPLKIDYSKNNNYQKNNITQMPESEPTLYNGTFSKPQILSQSVGQSILNSTKNTSIPQVQYNDLPEFEPMNVQSENVPVYNFGTTNYSRIGSTDSYASGSNGFGIDLGQLLQAGSALYSLWKLNNKRKQTQANKTQPQNNKPQPVEQGFEFIPE